MIVTLRFINKEIIHDEVKKTAPSAVVLPGLMGLLVEFLIFLLLQDNPLTGY